MKLLFFIYDDIMGAFCIPIWRDFTRLIFPTQVHNASHCPCSVSDGLMGQCLKYRISIERFINTR